MISLTSAFQDLTCTLDTDHESSKRQLILHVPQVQSSELVETSVYLLGLPKQYKYN